MTAWLILVSHGSTEAVRAARFPADEPLDERGAARAAALAGTLPKADRWLTGPELRARQTADALGLTANVEPALRDCSYARWTGCRFDDVQASEPQAISSWLRDPAAAPHGGESTTNLIGRVGEWLAAEQTRDQRTIVVTHPAVIRAAIVHAIEATAQSFWRIDIAPLSITRLSGMQGRWNLSAAGCASPYHSTSELF
jgi:broad specificity phosphatase PhoE